MLHSRDFRDEFEEKMKDEKFRKDIQERIKQSKQFKEELERKLSLSRDFRMQLPASSDESTVYAFVDTTQQARPNYYPREIVLGTTLGDANFKLWMERNIIPELKNLYPDNKFI
jgi:hypothetical protein